MINFAFLILTCEKVISIFVTTALGYSIIVDRAKNFIKVVRTLIIIKLKNIRKN